MWFILSFLSFLAAVVVHALWARFKPKGNRVRQFLVFGIPAGFVLLLNLVLRYGIDSPRLFAGALTYAFACELYIFLFTFVASSVSVSLLISKLAPADVTSAPEPVLTPADMVHRRLATMVSAGLLTESERGYSVPPGARRMVGIYRRLRQFFRHDGG